MPSIYYGEEIGLRYQTGLPDKEGSIVHPTYNRSGCRTPMQWDDSVSAGFSTATELYLPIDPAPDRPNVAAQLADPDSTLHLVRRLLELRRATPALGTHAATTVLHDGYPFAYLRGERHLVVVNPRREPASVAVPALGDGDAVAREGRAVRRRHGRGRGFRLRHLRGQSRSS